MTIDQIAYHLGRRDEAPNQELAAKLVRENDMAGIAEIAAHLDDKNASIASDCIKVMYEIGYLAPGLIVSYTSKFVDLLDHKRNRMVWGAMIALSTVAVLVPNRIWPHHEKIKELIESGTVITNVSGVRVLINLASLGDPYYSQLIDDLLRYMRECRKIDFAKRAGEMAPVIQRKHRKKFLAILEERLPELSKAAQKRLTKTIQTIKK